MRKRLSSLCLIVGLALLYGTNFPPTLAATVEEIILEEYLVDGEPIAVSCDDARDQAADSAEASQSVATAECRVVYQHTWEPDPPEPEFPAFGSCVEFIGFSQTRMWTGSITYGSNRRTYSGAGINIWADPDHPWWSFNLLFGGRECPDSQVTDVVLNVSFADFDVPASTFETLTRQAVDNIFDGRRPSVQNVWLQPVVGPPEGETCSLGQRAQSNFENIQVALDVVAFERSNVWHVHDPRIGDCSQYTSSSGHLNQAGDDFVAGEFEEKMGAPGQ